MVWRPKLSELPESTWIVIKMPDLEDARKNRRCQDMRGARRAMTVYLVRGEFVKNNGCFVTTS